MAAFSTGFVTTGTKGGAPLPPFLLVGGADRSRSCACMNRAAILRQFSVAVAFDLAMALCLPLNYRAAVGGFGGDKHGGSCTHVIFLTRTGPEGP